ncbi:MAG: C-GCAxxG-C-C family (seleno)protein, partial [Promethearchaeota archaeon]
MSKNKSPRFNINERFDKKIKILKQSLPKMKEDINCAALTLTNILNVIGLDTFYFNNLAIPLAGGYGGFKSIKGWKGPCGAVNGGCAAIGIIIGGKERLKFKDHMKVYKKAAI